VIDSCNDCKWVDVRCYGHMRKGARKPRSGGARRSDRVIPCHAPNILFTVMCGCAGHPTPIPYRDNNQYSTSLAVALPSIISERWQRCRCDEMRYEAVKQTQEERVTAPCCCCCLPQTANAGAPGFHPPRGAACRLCNDPGMPSSYSRGEAGEVPGPR